MDEKKFRYSEDHLETINREWKQKNNCYEQHGQVYHAKDIDKWGFPYQRDYSKDRVIAYKTKPKGSFAFTYYNDETKAAALEYFSKKGIDQSKLIDMSIEEWLNKGVKK